MKALSKKITSLELELLNSNGEALSEMQENVKLENTIRNLITSNQTGKQLTN